MAGEHLSGTSVLQRHRTHGEAHQLPRGGNSNTYDIHWALDFFFNSVLICFKINSLKWRMDLADFSGKSPHWWWRHFLRKWTPGGFKHRIIQKSLGTWFIAWSHGVMTFSWYITDLYLFHSFTAILSCVLLEFHDLFFCRSSWKIAIWGQQWMRQRGSSNAMKPLKNFLALRKTKLVQYFFIHWHLLL